MLKTYRIVPLVFILFLFGFTLFTVAPVLAQSTQELESRINALEELLCSLHPEAGTEKYSVCDVEKQRGREGRDSTRQINRAEAERVRQMEAERKRQEALGLEMEAERVRQEALRVRQAEMEAERVRQMEAERVRQIEEAEIAEYGNILPEAEREYVQKRMCRKFPKARSHQECMQKMKRDRTCRQNPTLAECSR